MAIISKQIPNYQLYKVSWSFLILGLDNRIVAVAVIQIEWYCPICRFHWCQWGTWFSRGLCISYHSINKYSFFSSGMSLSSLFISHTLNLSNYSNPKILLNPIGLIIIDNPFNKIVFIWFCGCRTLTLASTLG